MMILKNLGEPKYGFLINSGNIDSMVNHYNAFKKEEEVMIYILLGGKSGYRPNRAVMFIVIELEKPIKMYL